MSEIFEKNSELCHYFCRGIQIETCTGYGIRKEDLPHRGMKC